ncbi:hypothetical protein [Bradyrhizobium paxllaeri]|uniref:hypothetical protein n=1 Tax=Bradyrhizobium paxllaeri TaxID=190148 RepID=UPI000810E534|nr:hypothetical protein [Bradyrhizobium paxllaeri]
MLWLSLDADWQNALLWAVKAPSPGYWISSTVRWEKVALCLAWSFSVFLFYVYRYGMAARAIIALLVSVLLIQVVDAVLKLNIDSIPYLWGVVKHFLFAIVWVVVAPVLISAVLAYVIWTKRAFVQTQVRIASAMTLGACAMMVWVGLFDAVYPGIGWR